MISMVFYNRTLVNNNSTLKDTEVYSALLSPNDIEFILVTASKESLTTYSSCANGFNHDVKNFLCCDRMCSWCQGLVEI